MKNPHPTSCCQNNKTKTSTRTQSGEDGRTEKKIWKFTRKIIPKCGWAFRDLFRSKSLMFFFSSAFALTGCVSFVDVAAQSLFTKYVGSPRDSQPLPRMKNDHWIINFNTLWLRHGSQSKNKLIIRKCQRLIHSFSQISNLIELIQSWVAGHFSCATWLVVRAFVGNCARNVFGHLNAITCVVGHVVIIADSSTDNTTVLDSVMAPSGKHFLIIPAFTIMTVMIIIITLLGAEKMPFYPRFAAQFKLLKVMWQSTWQKFSSIFCFATSNRSTLALWGFSMLVNAFFSRWNRVIRWTISHTSRFGRCSRIA